MRIHPFKNTVINNPKDSFLYGHLQDDGRVLATLYGREKGVKRWQGVISAQKWEEIAAANQTAPVADADTSALGY